MLQDALACAQIKQPPIDATRSFKENVAGEPCVRIFHTHTHTLVCMDSSYI